MPFPISQLDASLRKNLHEGGLIHLADGLEKAGRVRGHFRKTKSGKASFVKEHARVVKHTHDIIQDHIKNAKGSILVFNSSKDALDTLHQRLLVSGVRGANIARIHSGVSPQDLQIIQGGTQSRGSRGDAWPQVILSTNAGAEGLSLTNVSKVVHMDQPTSRALKFQREARAIRPGNPHDVKVVSAQSPGPTEFAESYIRATSGITRTGTGVSIHPSRKHAIREMRRAGKLMEQAGLGQYSCNLLHESEFTPENIRAIRDDAHNRGLWATRIMLYRGEK